jgi:tripartite-type tricarboxylate transporter receptor subunit TctC
MYSIRPQHALALAVLCSSWFASFTSFVYAADNLQKYPERPIRMIMPNAPGSANDTMGRILAAKLGEALGQQIVVDNRAGAGGILGMEIGKNSVPDGYTLVSPSTAATSIAPHIQKKLPYDPVKDYEFISLFAVMPNILVLHPGQPPKTVREFIDYAKVMGNKLNMASAGSGAQSHLSGTALMVAAGIESVHVPYKGGGASVAATVAGESQWTFTPAAAVMSLIRGNRLRAIGHSLPKRTALLGDLPAIAETLPGFTYSGWYGLSAPKNTPKPVLDKIRNTLLKVAATAEFKELISAQAAEVVTNTPEEFRMFVIDEIAMTGKAVRAAGLKSE